MSANYPTKYAANRLKVTTNTIRNWSEQYADHLSVSARPGQQTERRFTEKDLTILEYIKQLRSEGLKESEIKQRLAETSFADTEVLSASENALQAPPLSVQTAPQSSLSPQEGQGNERGLIVVVDEHETRLALLEASVSEAKHSQRDAIVMFVIGFMCALVFVMFLLLLFLVRHWL